MVRRLLAFIKSLFFGEIKIKNIYVFGEFKYTQSKAEIDLLDIVNSYRVSIGLTSLDMIEYLSYVAGEHNDYMIDKQRPTHDEFDKRADLIKIVLNATRVGENIAFGYFSTKSTLNAWLNSKSHKANLQSNYTHAGVSIKTDINGVKFYTMIFIKK